MEELNYTPNLNILEDEQIIIKNVVFGINCRFLAQIAYKKKKTPPEGEFLKFIFQTPFIY